MIQARDYILATPTRFEISDGHEYYPVTYDGLIGRQGQTEQQMSGDWRVLGMSFHHWSSRFTPWDQIRAQLAAGESQNGYLWDEDHGSTRRWGRKVKMYAVSDPQTESKVKCDAPHIAAALLEDLESRLPYLLREFPLMGADHFRMFAEADPKGAPAVRWIAKQVYRGTLQWPDDADKVREALLDFEGVKHKQAFKSPRDLYAYETYADLWRALEQFQNETTVSGQFNFGMFQKIGRSGRLTLYSIQQSHNVEQAASAFERTGWCVKKPQMMQKYLEAGPLYFIAKDNKPYVLISLKEGEVADVSDAPVSPAIAEEILPLVEGIILEVYNLRRASNDQVIKTLAGFSDKADASAKAHYGYLTARFRDNPSALEQMAPMLLDRGTRHGWNSKLRGVYGTGYCNLIDAIVRRRTEPQPS